MDTRKLITAVLLTFAVVLIYQYGLALVGKKLGYDLSKKAPEAATQPAEVRSSPTTGAVAPATGPTASISAPALRPPPASPADPSPVTIGSAAANDASYRMAVSLSPLGASIDSVVLNQFKRTAEAQDRYTFQQPYPGGGAGARALATQSVVIDGTTVELHNVAWTRDTSAASDRAATFSTTISNDAGPVVRLTKTYEVTSPSDPGSGYELITRLGIENLVDRAVSVRTVFNGPNTPPREIDRGPDRYLISGYYDTKAAESDPITLEGHPIESFTKGSETRNLTTSEKYQLPISWAGSVSTYFDAIVRPVPVDGPVPTYIERVGAALINPDAPPEQHHVAITFATNELQLAPGQGKSFEVRTFLGPKKRSLLKDSYYSALGYAKTLVITGGMCAFCTFQWLIDILVWMLGVFHFILRDWGLAIIALVFVVRLILHPITKKSQISMMRMSKMGPEMEALRKKYGDNKEELSKAMMQFYKEQGIGPYLGCLPMFLQMPIWIALWSALNSTFELRQAPFLWGFTWIHDLSKPDNLIALSRPITLFGFLHITGLNILPLLLAVVFYFQMKMQPKPASMTKEQEQQQKIMMWMMPVLFPVMLYSGPSGLNLYILASTITGIIESKIVRDHIKKREEAEKAGRVIVDAGKKFGGGGAGAGGKKGPPDAPRGGLTGWLAGLQEKAEQLRREADRKRGQ